MNLAGKLMAPALLVLWVAGCAGVKNSPPKMNYYTLEYAAPQITGHQPLPSVIRVERFQVAPPYNSNQIIYKEKAFKRDAYVYHKWRSHPADMVTYFLARDLQQSTLFKAVFPPDSRHFASYVLDGTVDEILEQDVADRTQAILSVSITLLAANEIDASKKILFQKRYSQKQDCRRKNPRSLAESMSVAMARLSQEIITDIHHHLAEALKTSN
jgi:ABC-type uncharacterized transport system auxiliary subunit